jgi:lipid A 3-O-deacylase
MRRAVQAVAALLIVGVSWAMPSPARAGGLPRPTTVFAQAGVAEHAHAIVAGATWESAWQRRWRSGVASIHWEVSAGRWTATHEHFNSSGLVTQIGITPALRFEPSGGSSPWFVEAGIGLNVLTPIYQNGDKRFSTALNFGDHLAVGRRFGEGERHEIALRVQHFSNGGIRRPNPGEDFLQLRYSRQL